MLRAVTLGLSLCLVGCGWGGRVELLTGTLGCYAGGEGGPTALLVADPVSGTSFAGRPVMWPDGYTARRAWSEVEVLDAHGNVKARTGRIYHISFAYVAGVIPGGDGPFPAAVECGYPWDFVDCTAALLNQYCKVE